MTIHARAAVLYEYNGPFVIEDVTLDAPRPGEVLVRIVATGMCHTDAAVRSGEIPLPLPHVLGHEGAGVVEAVGAGVTKVAPGDHVVLTCNSCGQCDACQSGHPMICRVGPPLNFAGSRPDGSHALHCGDRAIHDRFFAQSSFATYAVGDERNTVKVPGDVPLELLGPLACGVQTGAGSVLNALKVGPGDDFVVFGAGAVGLSAVMAARVAGATTIVAVDLLPARLELAKELGATHTIDGKSDDVVAQIVAITGGGIRYALDTTGNVNVIRAAIEALGPGGTCGVLGASPRGTELSFPIVPFMSLSKRLMGIVEGDAVPDIFIPRMIELWRQGRFPFDRLVKFYDFADIGRALTDSERGITVKPVLRM
jgi:aryl-alcohol dehydrogenase